MFLLLLVHTFFLFIRQLIHAGQPQLPGEQRALMWGWLLERLNAELCSSYRPMLEKKYLAAEGELSQRIMNPTVFDSLGG